MAKREHLKVGDYVKSRTGGTIYRITEIRNDCGLDPVHHAYGRHIHLKPVNGGPADLLHDHDVRLLMDTVDVIFEIL